MRKKTQSILTELERNNKTAMTAHFAEVVVMFLFCLLQATDGSKSWAYPIIVGVLGFAPVIAELILYRKDKATPSIKHLVAIGFAVFYTYTLFTSTNNLVFTFVIPMIMIVSVYNDIRYSIIINTGVILESILIVALGAKTGGFGYAGRDSSIIQIVFILITGVYSTLTAKTLKENSAQKLQTVADAQQKAETLLSETSRLSDQLKSGIEDIYQKLEKLHQASMTTKDTMEQLSAGTVETADAIQNQTRQTAAIQSRIDSVNRTASNITENMHRTLETLETGSNDISVLVQKVENSVQNGSQVAQKLRTLEKDMEEMNSIVGIISEITTQTSLLALNASIEAARAGESGKGFSVVASEISKMATQTDDATVHITDLIRNVSASINEVVDVMYHMIDGITEERQSTMNTSESFRTIQNNTMSIRDHIEGLAKNISDLRDANRVITESTETISAISEEVSAHATETVLSEEKNMELLKDIEEKMNVLIQLI